MFIYNVCYRIQDEFALRSHTLAKKAQDAGLLDDVIPVKVSVVCQRGSLLCISGGQFWSLLSIIAGHDCRSVLDYSNNIV